MATFVDIDDVDGAASAASALAAAGERFSAYDPTPPSVDWGDDEFGQAMFETYPEDLVDDCQQQAQQVGESFATVGANVFEAMAMHAAQDEANGEGFDRV